MATKKKRRVPQRPEVAPPAAKRPPHRSRHGRRQPPRPAPVVQAAPQASALATDWPYFVLLALLAIGPLFRGLFFTVEQLVAVGVLTLITLAHWKRRFDDGRRRWLSHPLDYAVLAMLGAYCLATFGAADHRAAVQSDFKWLGYFLAFWLTARFVARAERRQQLYQALAAAGVLVSLVGIGAATGTVYYNGAFLGGRIYSTFQYPNATAAYLAAVLFPTLASADGARRVWSRALWMGAAGLIALVFLLAYSRGATVILPVAVLVYWLLLPAGRRGMGAVRLLVPYLVAFAALSPVHAAFTPHGAARAWALTVGAAVVTAAIDAGLGLAARRAGERRFLLGASAVGIVGLIGALTVGLHRVEGVLGRLTHLNPNTYNAWSRIQWSKDALHIWLTQPILGYGGGGWAAVYQKFQTYGYFSTQAHDVFAQILVGTGAVGFLVWIGLWLAFAWALVRGARRAGVDGRLALAPAGAGALMIGMHGTIDFTLSLAAITLAMFSLFAVVRTIDAEAATGEAEAAAPTRSRRRGPAPGDVWRQIGTYGIGGVVVVAALMLIAGSILQARGQQQAQAKQPATALATFQKAVGYDPLNAALRAELAQTLASQGLLPQAGQMYLGALGLSPFNQQIHTLYGIFLLQTSGQPDAGIAQLKTALSLGPFHATAYDELASAYVAVAAAYINQGHKQKADPYLKQVPGVAAALLAQSARVPPQARPVFPLASTSAQVQLAQGEADVLLGQTAKGTSQLRALAGNKQVGGQALLWIGVMEQSGGQAAAGAKDLAAAKKAIGSTYSQSLTQVKGLLSKAGVK